MLGSVPWWQKFSPSLLYIPTGTGLVLIKALWLMGEHIKLFSPLRLQSYKVILVTLSLSKTGMVEVEPAL